MNLKKFLENGFIGCSTVNCLCMVALGVPWKDDNNICNWHDENKNEWDVYVLSDGTAITWCLDL